MLPVSVLLVVACGGDEELETPTPLYGDVPIEYPVHLWDQGIEGETLLRVRVDDMGWVDSVEVVQSSGHAALDSAALVGARDLRFSPGRKKGKRVSVWANVPVQFSRRPPGTGSPPVAGGGEVEGSSGADGSVDGSQGGES